VLSSTRLSSDITAVVASLVAGDKACQTWQVSLTIDTDSGEPLDFENPDITVR
jgi:hypothetical protein